MQEGSVPEDISILCVDDDPLMGELLARWFRRAEGFHFLLHIARADFVEEVIKELHPDVVLMDVNMPGVDVVGAVARLATSHPTVHIAMFSSDVEPRQVRRCLDAGACGYLCKEEGPAEILAAVFQIAGGKRVLSPQIQGVIETAPFRTNV